MAQFRCWLNFATALGLATLLLAGPVCAQIAYGPDFNPNDNGALFDMDDAFEVTDLDTFGVYSIDDTFTEPDGNDAAAIFAGVPGSGADGATVLAHISNGENGNNGDDPMDPDVMNPADPNGVFAAIGNPSGRLENGNVVRYSMWMKIDPNDLVQQVAQTEPIVKLEFWTEARSTNGDFNPGGNPGFGDRIFDTDQNGLCFGNPGEVCASYVDMNGDGTSSSPFGTPPDATLTSTEWTLVSTEYEVDDEFWGYNLGGGFVQKTVADVEEIRPVMFLGDFAGTDLTNSGTLLVDNPMLEVYRTAADVPASVPNPEPGPTMGISGDFNNDGTWDCLDIDSLVAAVASGSTDLSFDMNGDGVVNASDITDATVGWLAVGGANNPAATNGNAFLVGDATLDGTVDGLDFIEWNANKFTSLAAWCGGDFNADGTVDGLDFISWNENKFTSSDLAVAVPEPTTLGLLLMAGLGVSSLVRRKRS